MITLEMYKDQIDEYFENTPPSEIIKRFEELGYEFEPIDTESEASDLPLTQVNRQAVNVEELCLFSSKEELIESSGVTAAFTVGMLMGSVLPTYKTDSSKILFKSNVLLDSVDVDAKFGFPFSKDEILGDDSSEENTPYAMAA